MYLTRHILTCSLDSSHTLLVNTLSGAIDVLDEATQEVIESLRKGREDSVTKNTSLTKKLRERGYLFDSKREEEELLVNLLKGYTTPKTGWPMQFSICPTFGCNLRCTYCFEKDLSKMADKVLSEEQIELIFKAIISLRRGKEKYFPQIVLFGGEPFLPNTKKVVERIVHKSQKLGWRVAAVTNGVNIPKFKDLINCYSHTFQSMQITLDGPREIHNKRRAFAGGKGTFDEIVGAIDFLLDNKTGVNLRVNVDGENARKIPEFAKFIFSRRWHENPLFKCQLAPVVNHKRPERFPNYLSEDKLAAEVYGYLKKDIKLKKLFGLNLFKILKHLVATLYPEIENEAPSPRFYFCETNYLDSYYFGPDGSIYVCPETLGNLKYAIGIYDPELQIYEERLSLWKGRTTLDIPKCRHCNIFAFCGGGCVYAALEINGSTDKPVCSQAQKIVLAFLDSVKEELVERFC